MTGTACLLLVLLLLRAILTVDPYFDSFAYHLPFAARLAGLCPETCYRMGDYLEAAYDGFPKLFHGLQGLVWKITGLAQAVDVLNVGALALFCLFLQRWFRVPAAWTFCALLAVPLIQIHATSTYIDLPVNLAAAAAILAVMALIRAPETFGWPKLIVLIACLAFAANSKPQMVGVAGPVVAMFGIVAIVSLASGHRLGPFVPGRLGSWIGLFCFLLLAGAVVGAKLVDNAVAHGNPFYPVRIAMLGLLLDGPIDGLGTTEDSLAETWRPFPSPLRWLISVLEVGAYGYREVPWTFDQGYCETSLAWKDCWRPIRRLVPHGRLLCSVRSKPGGFSRLAACFAAGPRSAHSHRNVCRQHALGSLPASLARAAVLPVLGDYSHRAVPDRGFRPTRWSGAGGAKASGLLGAVVIVALTSVLLMTQARYVTPIGRNVDSLIATFGVSERVAAIPDEAVVCVDSGWQPFTFLFAPVFHPGRSYTVLDGYTAPAVQSCHHRPRCGSRREIPARPDERHRFERCGGCMGWLNARRRANCVSIRFISTILR